MLPSPHQMRAFDDGSALARALAKDVAGALSAGIAARGIATVALSGGKTPAAFFAALFQQDLPWFRVQLTLVDDRCVPHDHARSNVHLLEAARTGTPAVAAPFIPLTEAATGAALTHADVPATLDVVVLGMGGDGHTASLFPNGDNLAAALADDAPRVLEMSAPGAPEPRVTFSLPAILQAGALFLHTEGAAKHDALRAALGAGPVADMPVRAVLRQTANPVTLFTSPNPGIPT